MQCKSDCEEACASTLERLEKKLSAVMCDKGLSERVKGKVDKAVERAAKL